MQAVSAASSPPVKPQGCTYLKLRQAVRVAGAIYDAEMAKVGLKTTQYSLLSMVVRLGPLRAVELAQTMHMSASTLSRNLRPLIEAGWVIQREGPDARSWLLEATATGKAKRVEAQKRWRAAQEMLNERLGVDRVVGLHALLDAAIPLLDEASSAEPD